ncbi:Type I secretion target repeat protein [Sulfitobacter noctilucae]|uniref:DUF4214 domain-containing protein n=1 Tax=Sulfitobacter noctilucae TaxID=1342302 RepID=UPI000469B5A0|nr:DUF4214 domain-containing protein [Sulfitobacter noctilucae]KIN70142.1 Type I secretion target repeat protein [Sulfitobacter noctilucae]
MALDLTALSTKEAVAAIFVGYYDRAPAPNGLNYWVNDIENNGFSLADVARAFALQDESQALYPALGTAGTMDLDANVTFVTAIFQNLFGRDPNNITDNGGADNFWVNELQNGADVGQLILDIISGAQGNDLAIITNKIEVGVAYSDASEAAGTLTRTAGADTILDDVDATAASVAEAKADIAETFPTVTPANPGADYYLTSGTDTERLETTDDQSFLGTDADDNYYAYIAQNPFAGGVSNTLSSADRLDGGAGEDTLYAELSKEFLGVSGQNTQATDIQPRLTSIEDISIEARDDTEDGDNDTDTIVVDAKNIVGHDAIGSVNSDGDLKIENLTTKETSEASSARNTSDITVKMEYTDNFNSDGDASDLVVLFDNDYLLSGQVEQGFADFFILDQDAELALLTGGEAEGRLDDLDKNGIQFRIDTNGDGAVDGTDDLITVAFADDLIVNDEINSHQDFRDALQDPLQALIDSGVLPEGTTIELFEYTQVVQDDRGRNANQATLDGGALSNLIPAIRVELGNDAEVVAVGFATPDTDVPPFNFFGRVKNEFEQDDQPISVNIDLEKAGRGGEGGNLIVGGKSASVPDGIAGGVEVFNVNVKGGSELPSWIGSLNSTLDTLDQVYVKTDLAVAGSGDVADLIIGEIGGGTGINDTAINGGETDVRYFDSTDFEGDLTAFANLDEFGNGAHSYLLGGGDDNLTIVFGNEDGPTPFGGAAGDSLTINTGAGNDLLIIDDVRAASTGGAANRKADLEFLNIETGAGDDVVFFDSDNQNEGPNVGGSDTTAGDGARISTSSGEDRIYMNDGTSEFAELDFSGLLDQDNFQFFGASLQIEMDGVLSEWVDISFDSSSYTTSREDIRDAIQAAVASNTALQGMIEIVELTDGSLQARSLVSDGSTFTVDLEGPVANAALIDNPAGNEGAFETAGTSTDGGSDEPQSAGDDGGWDLLNGGQSTINQVGLSQLANAWNAWYPGSTAFADLDDAGADFGSDGDPAIGDIENVSDFLNVMADRANALDFDGNLDGPTGNVSDDNVINAGGEDDLIVLTATEVADEDTNTEDGNGNVVEFTGQFGFDTIVNFTSDDDFEEDGSTFDNDILDFTSYLDAAADARGTSVGDQDDRVDEAVDFTFVNAMAASGAAADSGATVIDHNQIRLMDFSEIWNDLEGDDTGSGPDHYDGLTAADVDAWLELEMSAAANVQETGDAGGAVGSNFLILVGKDGDIEITYDGDTESFDDAHADNQFWAFEATVSAYDADDAEYDFTVEFRGGVDLAETDITGLSPDDFGVALFA